MSASKTTTDHKLIRQWVESRGGHPSRMKNAGGAGGLLRIDFEEPEKNLEEIAWDEFFRIFDENKLVFSISKRRKKLACPAGPNLSPTQCDSRRCLAFKGLARSVGNSSIDDCRRSRGKLLSQHLPRIVADDRHRSCDCDLCRRARQIRGSHGRNAYPIRKRDLASVQ